MLLDCIVPVLLVHHVITSPDHVITCSMMMREVRWDSLIGPVMLIIKLIIVKLLILSSIPLVIT